MVLNGPQSRPMADAILWKNDAQERKPRSGSPTRGPTRITVIRPDIHLRIIIVGSTRVSACNDDSSRETYEGHALLRTWPGDFPRQP